MSSYTIGEIAIWLLVTALLGFALGWLARELVLRTGASRQAPALLPGEPLPLPEEPTPLRPATPVPTAPRVPTVVPGPHPGSALPLDDGSAPSPDHVVKVSRSSKIYHAPSSPAWARTRAAWWFTSPEAAEAAGFRKPKNG